jgi:hypothetical protein
MSETKTISISAILNDLDNGLTRIKIGEKYSITPAEVKVLFEHAKLKGKKAKKSKALSFIIDDDTETVESEVVVEEVVVEEPATQSNDFE